MVVCFVNIGGMLDYHSINIAFFLLADCSRLNKESYIPSTLNEIKKLFNVFI